MYRDPEDNESQQEEWVALSAEQVEEGASGRLSERRARLWSLVLQARFLESRIERGERGWQVMVPPGSLERAYGELRLFVQENRNWPPVPPPPRPMVENTLSTLSVLILLATFHNVTTLELPVFGREVDWIAAGDAHAGLILSGEWWRLVTALTLHADWIHLSGNLAIGGVFVVCLCRDLGSGLAWTLLLASGALGNLLNAWLQLPSHSSVGSSTAVFGAVGIMGAISMVRYRHHLRRRWPLPIAAALSLLVLLGTEGERTDLGAHLFGFLSGILLGLATEWLVGTFGRPGRLANALFALSSAAIVVLAWWSAITLAY